MGIKKFLKWMFHLSYICIFLFFSLYIYTHFEYLINRYFISLKTNVLNVVYYFSKLSEFDFNRPIQVIEQLNEINDLGNGNYISNDIRVFVSDVKAKFILMFNKDFFLNFLMNLLKGISQMSKYMLLVFLLVLGVKMLISVYLDSERKVKKEKVKYSKDYDLKVYEKYYECLSETKPLKIYKNIRDKIVYVIKYIINEFKTFKAKRIYNVIVLFLLLFVTRIICIGLDLLGVIFILGADFNVLDVVGGFVSCLIDLSPILKEIPLWGYILIGYIVFDKLRMYFAIEKLRHYERYNKGFIKSTGVVNCINGAPGTKKMLTITDMSISTEEIFRTEAYSIIKNYSMMFPEFNFAYFEKVIMYKIRTGKIFNCYHIKKMVEDYENKFNKTKSKKYIFGYDYEKYPLYVNDKLTKKSLFEILKEYGQAYFVYSACTPLAVGNYPIRFDQSVTGIDKGYFPLWKYEYFKLDYSKEYSLYSKRIDFDSMRIGKKMIKDNPNAHTLDFGVLTFTEFGKERGNFVENQSIKKDDVNCNQKNDLTSMYFKMVRHSATIGNKTFIKVFMDEQRASSLSSDFMQLCEYTLFIRETDNDWKTSLFMFWLEPMIMGYLVNMRNKVLYKFRNRCEQKTLLIHLVNKIGSLAYLYLLKRENKFDYLVQRFDVFQGTNTDKKLKEKRYYLSKKKIWSGRYSTDCYAKFFDEGFAHSRKGFIDLENYVSIHDDVESMKEMHSFFVEDLLRYFKD